MKIKHLTVKAPRTSGRDSTVDFLRIVKALPSDWQLFYAQLVHPTDSNGYKSRHVLTATGQEALYQPPGVPIRRATKVNPDDLLTQGTLPEVVHVSTTSQTGEAFQRVLAGYRAKGYRLEQLAVGRQNGSGDFSFPLASLGPFTLLQGIDRSVIYIKHKPGLAVRPKGAGLGIEARLRSDRSERGDDQASTKPRYGT